jgi:hypothetical protein
MSRARQFYLSTVDCMLAMIAYVGQLYPIYRLYPNIQSSKIGKYPAKLIHGIIQIYKVQASFTLG